MTSLLPNHIDLFFPMLGNLRSFGGGIVDCGIRNPGLENPELSPTNPESEILESRIQVPLTRAGIQYEESGIHGKESRM